MKVRIQPLHPDMGGIIPLPKKMSEHAAGFDLAAAIDSTIYLGAGERALVPCGFAMALPPGYEGQIRPRSGLALKHGVTVLNAPGTVDSDYRGEVKVLLVNFGQMPFALGPGTRIAQLVVAPVTVAEFDVVMEIDETDRGQGGFGSTG